MNEFTLPKPALNVRTLCHAVNHASIKPARVERHICGVFTVMEAKPLGFGTHDVMLKLHKGGWITVDPMMCRILPSC